LVASLLPSCKAVWSTAAEAIQDFSHWQWKSGKRFNPSIILK